MQRACELRDERAVERVRIRACAAQHARELKRVLEHAARPEPVLRAVRQKRRKQRHVLLEDHPHHLGARILHYNGERVATPYRSGDCIS